MVPADTCDVGKHSEGISCACRCSKNAVWVSGPGSKLKMDNVTIHRTGGRAIHVSTGRADLSRIRVFGQNRTGISLTSRDATVNVSRSAFASASAEGILVAGGAALSANAVTVTGCGATGVYVQGEGTTAALHDVFVAGCTQDGVHALYGGRIDMAATRIARCGKRGVDAFRGGATVVMEGGEVAETTGEALRACGVAMVSMRGVSVGKCDAECHVIAFGQGSRVEMEGVSAVGGGEVVTRERAGGW